MLSSVHFGDQHKGESAMRSPILNTDADGRDLHRELNRLHVKMFRFARRICGNDADAEDIVGDAILGIMRTYDPEISYPYFETWVLAVVKNTARDHYRKKRETAD